MWHIKLLQHLAQKICKTDKVLAARFIEHLFNLFELIYDNFEIELSMVLGLIKDLYLFAEENNERDVPLAQFAEECMGLIILHAKATDDLKIYIADFIPLLKDETLFFTLDIEEKIKQLEVTFYRRLFLKNKDNSGPPTNIRQLISEIPNVFFLKLLTRIEKKVFAKLDYTVSVNPPQLIPILHSLLSEVDDQFEIVSQLLFILLSVEHEDEQFEQLIAAVKKIGDALLPPDINNIYNQLNEYADNSDSYFPSLFFCSSVRQYGLEVAKITEQIKQKKLNDVSSILDKLYEIKISNYKDKLLNIIQSIENQYQGIIYSI
jgi:hypothetical protein